MSAAVEVGWSDSCLGLRVVWETDRRVLDIRLVCGPQTVWGAVERRNLSLASSKVTNPEYTGRPARPYSSAPAYGLGI